MSVSSAAQRTDGEQHVAREGEIAATLRRHEDGDDDGDEPEKIHITERR